MRNQKGFTLIELLVVIAIIGLLSTLAVVSLDSAREKARDAKRLGDVKQFQTALELYYTDVGQYPTQGVSDPIILGRATDCEGQVCSTLSSDNGFASIVAGTTYMGLIPADPLTTQDYTYQGVAGGQSYTIFFTLEGTVNGLSGNLIGTPDGIQEDAQS